MDKGFLAWFTGLASSGKSTIATIVEEKLRERGERVENLDADEVRAHISPDLKFSKDARDLNTKRLAWIGKLLTRNGTHAIVAAVSSFQSFRDRARGGVDNFMEIFVKCPVEVCQERDPKGLYARAARGEINDIAGLHQPYEEPEKPELVLDTTQLSPEEAADLVLRRAEELGFLEPSSVYSAEEEKKVHERLEDLGYM